MLVRARTLFVFICFLVFSSSLIALDDHETVSVAGTYIPDLLDDAKEGPYIKLFDRFNGALSEEMALSIMPFRRAYLNFEKNRFDCLYTGVVNQDNFLGKGIEEGIYLSSDVINPLKLKAFTLRQRPAINMFDALEGKIITGTRGVIQAMIDIFGNQARKLVSLPVEGEEEAFQLLKDNKADVVLSFSVNAYQYLVRSKESELYHTLPGYSLRESHEVMVCHNTPKNQQLINNIDAQIRDLRANNELNILFGMDEF
ncbi:transporter substrate-binding domain-containing protein [Kordiimonas sp. SCSIO 12610]|uniref:transporter substrate-binding domain-containing protein n=1 Tax=Kordiimonas sp. SCSIO 12610 TaxID=2829597 RepID=UPI002109BAF2|nr:transporter substrate-binding domain-containing protein [Kordiimonas sp. SCSIO 12610]UTW54245.1 transporter substrate-binding domain-containing protein [Kordiimonas sp. SCSIO 12610]